MFEDMLYAAFEKFVHGLQLWAPTSFELHHEDVVQYSGHLLESAGSVSALFPPQDISKCPGQMKIRYSSSSIAKHWLNWRTTTLDCLISARSGTFLQLSQTYRA